MTPTLAPALPLFSTPASFLSPDRQALWSADAVLSLARLYMHASVPSSLPHLDLKNQCLRALLMRGWRARADTRGSGQECYDLRTVDMFFMSAHAAARQILNSPLFL